MTSTVEAPVARRSAAHGAPDRSSAPSRPEPHRLDRLDVARYVVVVVGTVVLALQVRRGWFYSDDLYNLTEARTMGFGWSYLTRDLFGHVVPGFMALVWLVARPGGAGFGWAVAETTLAFAGVLLLVGPTARALGASRRAALGATALTAAATLWISAAVWWAAALNAVPGALFGLAFLRLHLAWLERRTAVRLAAAALALALALSVQEGSVVFVVLVVAVTWTWHAEGAGRDRVRGLVVDHAPAWAAYAVPVLASFLLTQLAGSGLGAGHPGPLTLVEYPFAVLARSYLPSQLGLSVTGTGLGSEAATVLVALAVAALAVAWWRRATGPGGMVAVGILLAVVATRAVLVAWARSTALGFDAAADPRYLADLAWVTPVLWAAAWSRRPAGERGSVGPWPARKVATALVALTVVAGLAGQLVQGPDIGPEAAGAYRDRFAASWASAHRADPDATLLDVPAGPDLAPALLARFTHLSRTVAFGIDGLRFDGGADRYLAPDASGRVRPVHLVTRATLAAPAGGRCWASAAGPTRRLALGRPLDRRPWVVRLRTSGPVTAASAPDVWAVPPGGGAAQRLDPVVHVAADGTLLLATRPFAAAALDLRAGPGRPACVTGGDVSRIVPAAR